MYFTLCGHQRSTAFLKICLFLGTSDFSLKRNNLKKILLIEDDPHVCSFVRKGLMEENYAVETVLEGRAGIEVFFQGQFDLVILDIMLPTISGLEVCSRIREKSHVPILMLTALGTAENVALGLNTGADDYLVKPFKFIELIARIRSLLRRSELHETAVGSVYTFADLLINDESKTVTRGGEPISLTSTEYRLLLMFVVNARKVLSRMEILEEVWGVNFNMGTNVVDVYVNYLRKKLDREGAPKLIHTHIGMGYVLKEQE
jgi:two-component system copper resistance phosphate regulon response regulator CusR